MEASLAQLKNDKEILIAENRNLKTFMQAKDVQPNSHGRDKVEQVD